MRRLCQCLPAMDRYEVLEKIGEGTFGEVSKALDVETGEVVAIKRVRTRGGSGDGVPNTALREMRALQHLQHPNVRAALFGAHV